MADIAPFYNAGTVTIAAGSAALVGAGTSWATASGNIVPIRAGDIFMAPSGIAIPVLSVTDDTQITLAANWPGAALNASAYWIMYMTDGARVTAALNSFLAAMQASALQALAGVAPAADKLAYFNGANSAELLSFASVARSFLASNFMPVQQGGGAGQAGNKVFIGWATDFLKAQVDTIDIGRIWSDYEAARSITQNGYQELPGGLILQWGTQTIVGGDMTITFPMAFPTISPIVVGSANTDGSSATTAFIFSADQISKTQFAARGRFVADGGTVGQGGIIASWIAVGY